MNITKKLALGLLGYCMTSSLLNAEVKLRTLPIPNTTSPELQALIAKPPSNWDLHPKNAQEWQAWSRQVDAVMAQTLPALRQQLGVTSTSGHLNGVPIFTLVPNALPSANSERILLNLHGGGYVLGAGEAGTIEAVYMSGIGGFRVICVDYRMPPDFPYPAALDDAFNVYKALLKTTSPDRIGVFGTSTGGGMTLALMLRIKAAGLPLPAAIAPGTPWTDLTKTGDSYFTHEGVDNILVSYDGWLGEAAKLYANDHDLIDPMLSPIYGNVDHFPPALLTSGTRDLFLSNTVRMHLKLRQAGVKADLIVFEGMSHAQYHMNPNASESKTHFNELGRFFSQHLK